MRLENKKKGIGERLGWVEGCVQCLSLSIGSTSDVQIKKWTTGTGFA